MLDMVIDASPPRGPKLLTAILHRIEGDLARPPHLDDHTTTTWDQHVWRQPISKVQHRGVALCVACYAVELTGGRWLATFRDGQAFINDRPAAWNRALELSPMVLAEEEDPPEHIEVIQGHRVVHAQRRALRLLQLTPLPSELWLLHPLFDDDVDLHDIRDWLAHIG